MNIFFEIQEILDLAEQAEEDTETVLAYLGRIEGEKFEKEWGILYDADETPPEEVGQ